MARVGKETLLERELADDNDLGVGELYEQLITNVELKNALFGRRALTPRRVIRLVFDVVRARTRNGLRPYPATSIHAVLWLVVRDH